MLELGENVPERVRGAAEITRVAVLTNDPDS